jgi:hypothetical protein
LIAFRCISNAVLSEPSTCGAFAATLVKQASYFLTYSSHSATPTESPAGAFSVFASELEVAVFAAFAAGVEVAVLDAAVFALLVVAVLLAVFEAVLQPVKKRAPKTNAAIINTLG